MHAVVVEKIHADVQEPAGEREREDREPFALQRLRIGAGRAGAPGLPAFPRDGEQEREHAEEQREDEGVRVPAVVEQVADLAARDAEVEKVEIREVVAERAHEPRAASERGVRLRAARGGGDDGGFGHEQPREHVRDVIHA
jgi:hypothetical protein